MLRKLSILVLLTLTVCAVMTAGAQAADVTVGPDLTGTYVSEGCGTSCTLTNASLTQIGAQVISPVSGVVVRWHILGGATAGTYRLRAMTPLAPSSYLFTGSSAVVSSVPSSGIQTFTATMPIAAGQAVGVDASATASIGVDSGLGEFIEWSPPPPEGSAPASLLASPYAVGFNAEVQPAPKVTSLGTPSGPTAGGTSVAIAGSDLEGASAVKFGSTPAASYTINSESQITVVSPAGAVGSVPISLTTVAGTTTSSQLFTYQAPATPPGVSPVAKCVVPKLKGKKLKGSKKTLRGADCKVGKITKKKGAKAATGKVIGQGKKPGTVLPAGSGVKVTLGKG